MKFNPILPLPHSSPFPLRLQKMSLFKHGTGSVKNASFIIGGHLSWINYSNNYINNLLCVWLFATPWTVAHQVPGSLEVFSKSGTVRCHFLLQRIFPTQGSNSCFLCVLHSQLDSLPICHLGRHMNSLLAAYLLVEKVSIKMKGDLLFMEKGRISNINFWMSIY